ncbi:hypothetical protein [Sulfitobacter sp. 1A15106]|uniref:hypothetical protein n=1 Tax=Sulfitobacter sp. 1A15106 TaxID=3368590 RepID=UPI0037471697
MANTENKPTPMAEDSAEMFVFRQLAGVHQTLAGAGIASGDLLAGTGSLLMAMARTNVEVNIAMRSRSGEAVDAEALRESGKHSLTQALHNVFDAYEVSDETIERILSAQPPAQAEEQPAAEGGDA